MNTIQVGNKLGRSHGRGWTARDVLGWVRSKLVHHSDACFKSFIELCQGFIFSLDTVHIISFSLIISFHC
jgi:hypothetical protein